MRAARKIDPRIHPSRLPMLARAIKRFEFLNVPLLDFVPQVTPNFVAPVHLRPLASLIERAEREPVRALVSVGPRHGKSELILHGAAYLIARSPGLSVGYATYSAKLSNSKSRAARDYALRAGVKLREDAAALHEWRTALGGGMLAAGVGGTWTGHGVNVLFIDDPLANRDEAESPIIRDSTFDWLTSTAMTRVEPGGSIIINMARWHADDMIGRLEREQPGRWDVVNLPALDEEGQALWRERWPVEALKEKRAEIGEYDFASLYLGAPRPRGGQVFSEPARYQAPQLTGARFFIGVDVAATAAKTRSDYSVAVVVAARGSGSSLTLDILEVLRVQYELPELVAELDKMARKWNAPLIVEGQGVGKGAVQFLKRLGTRARVIEVSVKANKYLRAQPLAQAWGSGRVRVPASDVHWLRPYLTEMLSATLVNDRHDDCADATSLLFNYIANSTVSPVSLERGAFASNNKIHVPTDDWGRPIRS